MKHKIAHSKVFCIRCNQSFDSEAELLSHSCSRTYGSDGKRLLTQSELEELARKMVEGGIW